MLQLSGTSSGSQHVQMEIVSDNHIFRGANVGGDEQVFQNVQGMLLLLQHLLQV
jgi:hypothetical protein